MKNRVKLFSRIVAVSLIVASSGILSRASEADAESFWSCPLDNGYSGLSCSCGVIP